MSIASTLLAEFDHEMENTRKMLERVPDGKWDFKPHPKSMSLVALAGHIAQMAEWGVMTMEHDNLELGPDDYKPLKPSAPQDLVDVFQKDRAKFRSALESAPDDVFGKMWSMKWAGQTVVSMPRGAVLRSMVLNHMIHHRGQLSVYLRLLDVPVPGIYGPSADEMTAPVTA